MFLQNGKFFALCIIVVIMDLIIKLELYKSIKLCSNITTLNC
jgi:hypothetical protein